MMIQQFKWEIFTPQIKKHTQEMINFQKGYYNNYLGLGKPIEMLVGTISDQYSFRIPF